MRRSAKVSASRLPLRRPATVSQFVRRGYPAWITSDEGSAFSALAPMAAQVTARVRDSLVLRPVVPPKSKRLRSSCDVLGGR